MTERSCHDCRFSNQATPPISTVVECNWLTADCVGGDRIAEWAHEQLMRDLAKSRGMKLVSSDRAETCPAYDERDPDDRPGPLSEIITKGNAQ